MIKWALGWSGQAMGRDLDSRHGDGRYLGDGHEPERILPLQGLPYVVAWGLLPEHEIGPQRIDDHEHHAIKHGSWQGIVIITSPRGGGEALHGDFGWEVRALEDQQRQSLD